ncbi:MAG: sigma-70 family RNA polymerase sigma factor, partial [Planctomycetia bacterium]|nr:sigma-70 family RNA polymerase sigma factor [Planctomycetia bacterium]
IVDMAVVDVGLVVLTSTAAGQAGLVLLRGTSEQFRVEKLRELASPRRNTTQHRAVGDFWSAAGLYAFIAEDGGIWTTNGEAVNRIDGPTTINHENATEDDGGGLMEILSAEGPTAIEHLEEEEAKAWVRGAVDSLPENLRVALVLVYHQGMKYREAADVLGIPVGTVKSRLHAALAKLNQAWVTTADAEGQG